MIPLKDREGFGLSSAQQAALIWLVCIPRPSLYTPSVRVLRSLRSLGYATMSLSDVEEWRITNAGRRKYNEVVQRSLAL